MTFDHDIFSMLIGGVALFLCIYMFVRISRRLGKSGGSMATVTLGATGAFYHSDKKKTVEVIVERNAGKKMEEQSSSEPERETGISTSENN
ncbi:MAG: hypothetical protein ACE5OR_07100 [bacterium]